MITKEELYPLPDLGVEPHLVSNFFPEEMFADVKKHISKTGMGTEKGVYHPMMGRYASGIKLPDEIEEYALDKVREIFKNDSLVRAYHYTVMYQIKDECVPNLWEHLDQNGSQVSINIAIENTAEWPIIVEGISFSQKENDAVVFCGQQHMHGRPPYPTKNKDLNTTQLFLHYSTPDHWIQDKKSGGVGMYGKDGDIRFFNRNRYFPLPDPPVNQLIGGDQDYSPVLRYYEEVVGHEFDTESEISDIKVESQQELAPGIILYKTNKDSSRVIKGLVQNSMFKQWREAEVAETNSGNKIDYNSRNCYNYFLGSKQDDCHPQDPIVRAKKSLEIGIEKIVENYQVRFQIKPIFSKDTVLLRYEQGNMFHGHFDASKTYHRIVSVVMFLNEDFTGGELEFKEFGLKIKPQAGDVLVFPSSYPYMHKVNSVKFGVRYSVVKWYEFV
jgi:hypothetical protein